MDESRPLEVITKIGHAVLVGAAAMTPIAGDMLLWNHFMELTHSEYQGGDTELRDFSRILAGKYALLTGLGIAAYETGALHAGYEMLKNIF